MTAVLEGLTKTYGSTTALDAVDLTIASGRVHALLGHNGAGKSTLIKCLGGGTAPTAGTMALDGEPLTDLTPKRSKAAGIAVIYQHLSVVGNLTVAENLFLGSERRRAGILVDRATQRELAAEALAQVGSRVSPDARVRDLPVGQRQLVEIAKALQREARLLVLDEPTASLSTDEAARLGELVLDLRSRGLAILYVTHLLNEVVRLADDVSALRNGRKTYSAQVAGLTKADLVAAVSGGHGGRPPGPGPLPAGAAPVLETRGLTGRGMGPVDLTVRAGEIVALYGLVGSGRTRVLETLYRGGEQTTRVDGRDVAFTTPAGALEAGIALVPGDRHTQGLFGSLPALDNTVFRAMRSLAKGPLRSRTAERTVFRDAAEHMTLRPPAPDLPAARFSGGNQQKILIGRWIDGNPGLRVLLLDEPTQGVDVGARQEIYDVVHGLARDTGTAVLVATNEAEEVLALAHRCLLVRDGKVVQEIDVAGVTEEDLLALLHDDDRVRTTDPGTTEPGTTPTTPQVPPTAPRSDAP